MRQIVCNTFDELPIDANAFSDYANLEFIISPKLMFEFKKTLFDFRLETQSIYLPYNYRLRFLHPGYYYSHCFTKKSHKKIHALYILAKRGSTIRFIVDSEKENSVVNSCLIMKECFHDCKNEGQALTNIPFPVKKEDSSPFCWIWSCYWDPKFPETLNEEQSKAFINEISFEFPNYDSRFFPVEVIGNSKEGGVTAFSVKTGEGKILVIPPERPLEEPITTTITTVQEQVQIEVKEFPIRLSLINNQPQVFYDIIFKEQRYTKQASALSFLRLLTLYYASQGDNCFGFTLDDGELDNIFILKPSCENEEITWSCIFNTPSGQDSSFSKTLNKIIKLVLLAEYKDEVHKLIVDRLPGGHRKQQGGFTVEKLNNLTINFLENPFHNFRNFTLTGDKKRNDTFSEVLFTFKDAITPLITS